ncbi:MAG: P-loop NTPase, partial [Fusobacterium polymorphum]
RLKEELEIPVFHDDQHGTAIACLAGVKGALRLVKKDLATAKIVVNGAGAAGANIARLLYLAGARDITLLVSSGVLHKDYKRLDSLKASFDYILIDCPAGIEQGFKNAIVAADEAVVVTTPEVSATRDADRIIGLLEAAGIKEPRLVINRIRIDMVKDKNMLSVEDILDILAIKLLGVIPDDESVVISTNKGEPLVYKGDSLAAKAFKNIASRLEGIDVPLLDLDTKMSFLDKIKFVLKR